MVLVTGGTGFLGAHLLRQLLQRDEPIRCIYRKQPFKYLTEADCARIEWIRGDLLDVFALEQALSQVETVYHCAGQVSFDPRDKTSLFKTNVEGTANLVNACIGQGIRKLVHVSSVATLGRPKNGHLIDEQQHWDSSSGHSLYAKSKFLAEMEVWRAIGEGLSAVIVNPSILLGPALYWQEGSPRLIQNIASGFKYYTDGINGFTDVRDTAALMIQLMDDPVSGEQFIINTENWSYKKLFLTLQEKLATHNQFRNAGPLVSSLVWRMAWLQSRLTGRRPLLTKETAHTARQQAHYSAAKIRHHFPEFSFTPLEQTLTDACAAFREQQA